MPQANVLLQRSVGKPHKHLPTETHKSHLPVHRRCPEMLADAPGADRRLMVPASVSSVVQKCVRERLCAPIRTIDMPAVRGRRVLDMTETSEEISLGICRSSRSGSSGSSGSSDNAAAAAGLTRPSHELAPTCGCRGKRTVAAQASPNQRPFISTLLISEP